MEAEVGIAPHRHAITFKEPMFSRVSAIVHLLPLYPKPIGLLAILLAIALVASTHNCQPAFISRETA